MMRLCEENYRIATMFCGHEGGGYFPFLESLLLQSINQSIFQLNGVFKEIFMIEFFFRKLQKCLQGSFDGYSH